MSYSKIGSIEAIALIVIVILNHLILNLPKNFLETCGPSAPINVIFVSILVFIFLYFIIKLFKNFNDKDILDVSDFLAGKTFRNILGIIFIVYFIVISSTLLRNFCELLKIVYFEKIPITLLLIIFLTIAVIANKVRYSSIVKNNLIIVASVIINLLIVFFLLGFKFVPQRIFPILGYGINETFFSGATNIFAFTGISYIYFLQPMLKDTSKFKHISFIGIGISSLYVLLSIISLLFSFSDALFINDISPIYLLIRGADLGRFLQRPDAIFFLGWILSLMSYLSITIMFITKIFKKIFALDNGIPLSYMSAVFIFIFSLIPEGMVQIRFMENIVFKYFTIILLYIVSFTILILANIKYKKYNKLKGGFNE